MKVYRIKHKPSGKYYDKYAKRLTEDGSVIELKPYSDIMLLLVREKYRKQYHPDEFETIEYGLIEIHYPKEVEI